MSLKSLDDVKELYAWMREHGVQYAKVGDIELSLGEPPRAQAAEEAPEPYEPDDAKTQRRKNAYDYFNGMFGRPPTDQELDMYEGAIW